MANTLVASPAIYRKVGLWIGCGPGKTELILHPDPSAFHSTLEVSGGGLPNVVISFTLCLGAPRHASNDGSGLGTSTLAIICFRQDRLLDLVEDVADEDPFAALLILQVCGVQRVGHVISAVPPPLVYDFETTRDDAVASTLATIQLKPPSQDSTHPLPTGAGGGSRISLARHASGIYLGAFFRVVAPLQQRLKAMGGRTIRAVTSMLVNLDAFRDS